MAPHSIYPSVLTLDETRTVIVFPYVLFLQGKSVLLRELCKWLKQTYGNEGYRLVAPTGCAAVNVGGITLHSLAGAGVPRQKADFKYMSFHFFIF